MSDSLLKTIFVLCLSLTVQIFGKFLQLVDFMQPHMAADILALSVEHVLYFEQWTIFLTALCFARYENAITNMERAKVRRRLNVRRK
jgi:hypothetical protein